MIGVEVGFNEAISKASYSLESTFLAKESNVLFLTRRSLWKGFCLFKICLFERVTWREGKRKEERFSIPFSPQMAATARTERNWCQKPKTTSWSPSWATRIKCLDHPLLLSQVHYQGMVWLEAEQPVLTLALWYGKPVLQAVASSVVSKYHSLWKF